jgi:hypothetical protein
MQAVAVGASLAYPLLRLARSIPVPILMVGAGLFFAGSKTGQSITQKASDMASDLSEDLSRRGHDLTAQAGEKSTYETDQTEAGAGVDRSVDGGLDGVAQPAGRVDRRTNRCASVPVVARGAVDQLAREIESGLGVG